MLPGPRELAPGADTLELKLKATAANGDKVVQMLTFHRGSYVIDVGYDVTNDGAAPDRPYAYFQLTRDSKAGGLQSSLAPVAYTGPVVYNETDKYKKIEFGELDKLAADPPRKLPYTAKNDNGWVGMVEHYFVTAWLPGEQKTPREFYTRKLDDGLYAAGVIVPVGADRARRDRRASRCRCTSGRRSRTRSPSSPRASTSSSTTASSPSSPRRCSGCCRWLHGIARQLGLGDHRADHHHQERRSIRSTTPARARWRR